MSLFRVSLLLVGTVPKSDSESIRKWLKMKIQNTQIKIRLWSEVKFETSLFKHLKIAQIIITKIFTLSCDNAPEISSMIWEGVLTTVDFAWGNI